MRPVLFTQRVDIVKSYGERRDAADQRVADFIYSCGFLPIPLPNKPIQVKQIFHALNPAGIVLTGGNSLVKYGGNAPERDGTDKVMLEIAVKDGIPLYGFCRGMQSILDYFGNDLVDVPGHVAVRHKVVGAMDSQDVNSYHKQGCLEIASADFEVLFKTVDGVIEMVHHRKLPIVGTMWHPERETPFREEDITMVKNLFGGENNEGNHFGCRTGNQTEKIY